ncbi:MAG TPA: sigma-70 family RNA polymerase sigma factor, partial [Planctomycetaceae bacterium]|nr:sigma-70 family RNA polymerase sigma factor [Planctomycetaceae bacterium]
MARWKAPLPHESRRAQREAVGGRGRLCLATRKRFAQARHVGLPSCVFIDRTRPLDEAKLTRLVEQARRRDLDALAALCEHFYPKVLRYMHYRIGPQWAEDLAADVFLRVVRNIDRQTGSFVAWLYQIAAHVVVDHSRREKVRRTSSMDEQTIQLLTAPDNPSKTAEQRADLLEALACLTDEQRELITLKFIQGLSNLDIAKITGRKPDA